MLKIAYSPIYNYPVPAHHRFPMEKYDLLPKQLIHEGIVEADAFFEPTLLDESVILLTHTASYWHQLKNGLLSDREERVSGFSHSPKLIEREITILQGSLQSAFYALEHGISFNIAGGTHHAFSDHGEGFCLLNDIAVSINYLLAKKNDFQSFSSRFRCAPRQWNSCSI